MTYTLTIPGRLKSINDYTDAQRRNRYAGAEMKQNEQEKVEWAIKTQLHNLHITSKVYLEYKFYEKNKKRDLDNISGFAHKVIQDALVSMGVLKDDGWDEIVGFADNFQVDQKNPRIVVEITEVEDLCHQD